jgi:hypothetical protein
MTVRRRRGPVERKVRADIGALITAHPMGEALSEMSYALAAMLDGAYLLDEGVIVGIDPKAAAPLNRELRANLMELARLAVDDDDDLADELSAPVRDQAEP